MEKPKDILNRIDKSLNRIHDVYEDKFKKMDKSKFKAVTWTNTYTDEVSEHLDEFIELLKVAPEWFAEIVRYLLYQKNTNTFREKLLFYYSQATATVNTTHISIKPSNILVKLLVALRTFK